MSKKWPDKYLGIWGIERSGTNWLEVLLRTNTDCYVSSFNKHGPRFSFEQDYGEQDIYGDNTKFVAIIKNPYAWVYSNAIKWRRPVRPRFNSNGKHVHDIDGRIRYYYNYCNMSYIDMEKNNPDRVIIITYRDLLENPMRVIKNICGKFDIGVHDNFVSEERAVGPVCSITGKYFDKTFYTNEEYLVRIKPSGIDAVNRLVDPQIMSRCNFEYREV